MPVSSAMQESPHSAAETKTAAGTGLTAGRVRLTDGRISAKRLLPGAQAAGYDGSPRNLQLLSHPDHDGMITGLHLRSMHRMRWTRQGRMLTARRVCQPVDQVVCEV